MKVTENDSTINKLKTRELVLDHINYLDKNLNPLDKKGEEYKSLHYSIDDYSILNCLFDSLVSNNSFKGELSIESKVFDDNIGYKISKIIGNNNMTLLKIGNRVKPFSDRVAKQIGEALASNTKLTSLEIFLDVEELSPLSLCKFLNKPNSSLKSFSFLKINKELINLLSDNLRIKSKLNCLKFFYEPLRFIDLCYKPQIEIDVYNNFAEKIQNHSNLIKTDIIPLFEEFDKEINQKLTEDINVMEETLKFSCESNFNNTRSKIEIDKLFERENNKMNLIIQNLHLIKEKYVKNSVVSVRSYLQKTIGELLNNALYELEIRRERYSDDKDLFTAKGSIRFISNFLINHNS